LRTSGFGIGVVDSAANHVRCRGDRVNRSDVDLLSDLDCVIDFDATVASGGIRCAGPVAAACGQSPSAKITGFNARFPNFLIARISYCGEYDLQSKTKPIRLIDDFGGRTPDGVSV
jgi:hypothetical protein